MKGLVCITHFCERADKKGFDRHNNKKGEGRNRIHDHWSDIISYTCNQTGRGYSEIKLKTLNPKKSSLLIDFVHFCG